MPSKLEVEFKTDSECVGYSLVSDRSQRSVIPAANSSRRVLLVGRDSFWGIPLLKSLEKLGSSFSFTPALRVTTEFVKNSAYSLLLFDSTVPPQHRKQTIESLIGSAVSAYYAYPVDNACWWVPALRSGKDCHGSPAFRANEFLAELQRALAQKMD
jgi:hypothetical protein